MSFSVFNFDDFSGGYFTNVVDEQMEDNELLQADNCFWDNGLIKRKGVARQASNSCSTINGAIRVKIKGSWYTILAVSNTQGEFQIGTGTTLATLTDANGSITTLTSLYVGSGQVNFASLGEKIITVNGVDEPRIIYQASDTIVADRLETYDTRTRGTDYWVAGRFSSATGVPPYYVDDTDDAQSSTSADFVLGATGTGSGFYIGCDFRFNKIKFADCETASGTFDFVYDYYGRASVSGSVTWQTVGTFLNEPDWSTIGDKTLEFNLPFDTNTGDILMDRYPYATTGLTDHYVLRGRPDEGTAPIASWACADVVVQNSQYLREILLNDKPNTIAEYKSRIVLGMDNWVTASPINNVTGWRGGRDSNYFKDGGRIQAMVSHLDYLCVVLDDSIYGLGGNSWENWTVRSLAQRGAISGRSVALVNEEVYFVARDGVYGWNGTRVMKFSKHIQSDIDSYTLTDSMAINYKGYYWVVFPTDDVVLLFDPDTYRADKVGDGVMSFYKYSSYPGKYLMNFSGAGDSGDLWTADYLSDFFRLYKLETGVTDIATSAAATINMQLQTKYYSFKSPHTKKIYKRYKPTLSDVSATAAPYYNLILRSKDTYGISSVSTLATVSWLSSGIFQKDITVSKEVSGNVLSLFVQHEFQDTARFYGFAVDAERRIY